MTLTRNIKPETRNKNPILFLPLHAELISLMLKAN